MRTRKFPGEKPIAYNGPEFINGLDKQDVDAVFRSIVTYWKEPYKFTVDETSGWHKGEVWSPYLYDQQKQHKKIILVRATGLCRVYLLIVFGMGRDDEDILGSLGYGTNIPGS